MAENQSSSDTCNRKFGIGAIISTISIVVAVALIFMSQRVRNTTADTTIKTKTTPPQTVFSSADSSPQPTVNFPVDLNEVTFEQLIAIDSVGEALATKIIAHRDKIGQFTSMSQLLEIDGIGEKRFETLCRYLYIDGEIQTSAQTSTSVQITTSVTTKKPATTPVTTKKPTTTSVPTSVTTKKPATTPEPVRRTVNINTATVEELMEGLLLTYEEAQSIVTLRNNITYFQNPLEVLYCTDEQGKTMFSDSEFNKFKDYIVVD